PLWPLHSFPTRRSSDLDRRDGLATSGDNHSAATCVAASTRSTFAAQYLYSGILPNGSSAGLVRRFAAASTKANGMNTTPSGTPSDRKSTRLNSSHLGIS